jgi:DNA replicative helicase MCM subunit Mcm2 (Cdc46/Mcm family)
LKENIKISHAILTRFDLIFLILDSPDTDRDQKLSEHIMKMHNFKRQSVKNRRQEASFTQFQQKFPNTAELSQPNPFQKHDTMFLSEHYQLQGAEFSQNQVLDPYLLKKYLRFVKQQESPRYAI